MIELLVTENMSTNPERFPANMVRVFVDRNYSYGLWILESRLFSLLTSDQQGQYLSHKSAAGLSLQVEREVAQAVIDAGQTPYGKQKLRPLATV